MRIRAVIAIAAAAPPFLAAVTATAEGPEWARRVHEVDRALTMNDAGRATRALQEAHVAAVRARGWEGLVEVGSAALRVGDALDNRNAGRRKARRCYLEALLRARNLRSLEGVVRAAEAFAMLGDHDVAEHALQIAESLGAGTDDPPSLERLETLRERLVGRGSTAGTTRMQ